MLNSFLGANAFMIVSYIISSLLVVSAVGLFLWYYLKSVRFKDITSKNTDTNAKKIDDETYVIEDDLSPSQNNEAQFVAKDNAVEHFANQISNISDSANADLSKDAIVVKHEVETAAVHAPKKDEIQNYVMVSGVKKQNTSTQKMAAQNRGTNAFQNSTDFLNRIKEENSADDISKQTQKPAKKIKK